MYARRSRFDPLCKLLVLLVGLSLLLAGCRPTQATPAAGQSALQGTIRVSGAFALYPMMQRWAEEFTKLHPQVRLDVSAGGAGKGMTDALGGLVDLGMISREIAPDEIQKGAVFVPVVKDTVVVIINAGNPERQALAARGVKRQTLVDLWMKGAPLTWGDIAGTPSQEAVQLYTRSDSCGAADTWAKYLGGKQEDLKGTGVFGDPGIAEAVAKDTFGIGYSNLNYAYDAVSGKPAAGLAVLAIDVNQNGQIDPAEQLDTKAQTIQAILAGVYPSPPSRDLYLVTKGQFSGLTLEFVRWVLTDGQRYVEEAGYLKLPQETIDAAIRKLAP